MGSYGYVTDAYEGIRMHADPLADRHRIYNIIYIYIYHYKYIFIQHMCIQRKEERETEKDKERHK